MVGDRAALPLALTEHHLQQRADQLGAFEIDARRLIQARLERGRIDVSVQLGPPPGQSTQQIRIDTALAAQYIEQARALGRATGLGDEVPLAWVLERPGVVVRMEDSETTAGATFA